MNQSLIIKWFEGEMTNRYVIHQDISSGISKWHNTKSFAGLVLLLLKTVFARLSSGSKADANKNAISWNPTHKRRIKEAEKVKASFQIHELTPASFSIESLHQYRCVNLPRFWNNCTILNS
jgi:hypothetical protein